MVDHSKLYQVLALIAECVPELASLCKQVKQLWASLVAQWLKIRPPMQGTRVRALVQEDPPCRGATKPVRHNY